MAFEWLFGQPSRMEYVDLYTPQQQQYQKGQMQKSQQALGQAQDYYGGIMGGDMQDFNMMAQPYLRQYEQQTAPGIAERFASGNSLRSSGFNQAMAQSGRELQENLASMGANMKMQAAQGLTGIGQYGGQFGGLQTQQPVFKPQTPGALDYLAMGIAPAMSGGMQQLGTMAGKAAGAYFGMPIA